VKGRFLSIFVALVTAEWLLDYTYLYCPLSLSSSTHLIPLFHVSSSMLPPHHHNTHTDILLPSPSLTHSNPKCHHPTRLRLPVRPAPPVRARHHISNTEPRQLPQQQHGARPHRPPRCCISNVYRLFNEHVRQTTLLPISAVQTSAKALSNTSVPRSA
jgi:hypothetical protein